MTGRQVRDPRRALAAVLRAYRADAELALLGLAYAGGAAPDDRALSLDDDHPMAHRCTHGLADPGGWRGIWNILWHGQEARRLRAFGLDTSVFALAETLRIERAQVGPEQGALRRREHGSPAWRALCAQARMVKSAPLWRRAGQELEKHEDRLPSAMGELMAELRARLLEDAAREGVKLAVLPLPSISLGVAAKAENPCPVAGATSWGVRASIGVNGATWAVIAQLEWLGDGRIPSTIPRVDIVVGVREDERARRLRWPIPDDRTSARFASDAELRGTVILWAEAREVRAGDALEDRT